MKDVEHPPLDAERVLGVLEAHRVEYVVVGGYAAELHGSVRRTVDVDVVPETSRENPTRLAAALAELGARIRTDAVPEGLLFTTSAEALDGVRMLDLVTDHGELDLTFTPSGTQGYADLSRAATEHAVGGVVVHVAALADVIRSKTAAARNKDLAALPELRRLAAQGGPRRKTEHGGATAPDAARVAEEDASSPSDQMTRAEAAAARIAAARALAAADRRRRSGPPASSS